MDPIGAAASLVTLLAVSKNIADRGLALVRRYRGYSAAQTVLRDRLFQLEVQLSLLRDVKKVISESDALSNDLKDDLLQTLSTTRVAFESIRGFFARNNQQGGTRARLRWARNGEAEVREWTEKLAQHGQDLVALLSTLQIKLSAHSLEINEASNTKLDLLVKNQREEKQLKRVAFLKDFRKSNETLKLGSDEGMLWGFLLRLPPGIRYLTCLRQYTIQFSFSILRRPLIMQNVVPDSSEIFQACKSGDALGVKQLLDLGKASPHDVTPRGSTPLRYAIESGSKSLVQLLLDYGADPDTSFGQMHTSPIAWAFGARQIDIARFLYSRGGDIDSSNTQGWTPLFYLFGSIGSTEQDIISEPSNKSSAYRSSVVEYLQFLSSASLQDINAPDHRGWTSLHRASIHGRGSDILDFIQHANASLSPRTKILQWSPIFTAVHSSNISTFNILADHHPQSADYANETDIQGWTLLHVAAGQGCKEIMRRLLDDGADVHRLSDWRADRVPAKLKGREATPLDVAKVVGGRAFAVFLEVLEEWNREVRVIWEGEEEGKCCDVFFPCDEF